MHRPPSILASLALWSFPVWVLIAAGMLGGANDATTSLTISSLILLYGALIVLLAARGPTPATLIISAFLVLMIGFARYQGWLTTGAPEYISLLACGTLFYAGFCAAHESLRAEHLWRLTLYAGGVIITLGYYGLNPLAWLTQTEGVYSASNLGCFYAIIALMSVSEFARTRTLLRRAPARQWAGLVVRGALPSLGICLVSLLALLNTGAQLDVIALIVGLLVLGALELFGPHRFDLKSLAITAMGAVMIGLGLYAFGADTIRHALSPIGDLSGQLNRLAAYWQAIQLEPVFGHGLGGFAHANALSVTPENHALLLGRETAGNLYLQWLLQAGWVGTGAMGLIFSAGMGILIFGLQGRYRNLHRVRGVLVILLLVGLNGLVDDTLELPVFAWLIAWLFGLGIGMTILRRQAV
ncbi:MAG: hypothetical protein GYB36_01935 [Alphaproteobacteria bacterium]|nr:hypothetical protein [Alphaproteobacteria bacterium]